MSKSDFISQMVEDTIADTEPRENNILSFEAPKNICHLDLELNEKKKCYVLRDSDRCLEIPINWGPFKNRISREFTLGLGEDKHLILSMLSVFFDKPITNARFSINRSEELNKAA